LTTAGKSEASGKAESPESKYNSADFGLPAGPAFVQATMREV